MPSISIAIAPDSGTPFADCNNASNTGVLSNRGMQHHTTWAVASTSALMAQLPIIARSSDAVGAVETTEGLLMFEWAPSAADIGSSIEQRPKQRDLGSAGKRRARLPPLADRADDPAATSFPAAADRGGDRHGLSCTAVGRRRHAALVLARPRQPRRRRGQCLVR